MLISVGALVVGLALLVWGSDRFVLGAAATARNLGVPSLIVGLTVVGIGTSAPEILVSAVAALDGNPGLAIGNAFGSNIANIGLVAGVTALVAPLAVRSQTLKREFPIMVVVMLLAWLLLADHTLGRLDGAVLMAAFVAVLVVMVVIGRRARHTGDPLEAQQREELAGEMGIGRALLWILVGLLTLLLGSRAIVWGAVNIAHALGVSDVIIGLTVVAIGTSLPELGASVAGVLKGESDIAIGNVIGSNIFNMLPVLAMPGLLAPSTVPNGILRRDLPIMLGFSVALLVMAVGWRGEGRVNRLEGAALLLAFCAYQAYLYGSP